VPRETPEHYYTRMISELKDIANAIKHNVHNGVVMDVIPILLVKPADILPGPRACGPPEAAKRKYDIWLNLTYKETRFLYELHQWDGVEFKLLETTPDPLPDATQMRVLLAEAGTRIGQKSVQPIPVEVRRDVSRGIIFLYDSSGSMQQTDHGARNRLGVGQAIGEIVAQTAHVPFAVVVFADSADVLESKPGSSWFDTTPADLQVAQTRLAGAFKDMGNTNIGAAFEKVALLISSRKDIDRWHVVFLTDGEPTAGNTNYAQITKLVTAALGGKSTLSVIALHGNDPLHTQQAKLEELARVTTDGTGQSDEVINLKMGDDPKVFRSRIEKIAFPIIQATVRDESMLLCTQKTGVKKVECELDPSQSHALRFGAAQKVSFVVDTTAFPAGTCTATIENQGLGAKPRTVVLPAGQPRATLSEPGFKIVLSRSSDRVFLVVEKLAKGRLNGDWQIKLTAEAAAGSTP